jgi:hypothetical protein
VLADCSHTRSVVRIALKLDSSAIEERLKPVRRGVLIDSHDERATLLYGRERAVASRGGTVTAMGGIVRLG